MRIKETIVRGLSDYAPTRGFALILAIGLLSWGGWLLLPFDTFANPIYAFMAELAIESVWGAMFAFAGVTLGVGVWSRDHEWISRGAFLGFTLWIIIAILGLISDPSASIFTSRMTIAVLHAWLYVQVHLHPELVSGEISIKDLKDYKGREATK